MLNCLRFSRLSLGPMLFVSLFQLGVQGQSSSIQAPVLATESEAPVSVVSEGAALKAPLGKRTYKGDVGFTLMGRRMEDQIVNSRFSRLIISMSLAATYQEWLSAKLGVVQLLTSGQASNLYAITEGTPSSATLVDEASLNADISFGSLAIDSAVGILNINLAPFYSNMYTQSNAGGEFGIGYQADKTEAKLFAAQSIPTSKSNSNRVIDENTLPLLSTWGAQLVLPVEASQTTVKAALTRFVFTDLSAQAAMDSSTIGSTTTGNGKGGFQFTNEYRGTENSLVLEQGLFLADLLTFKVAALKNELAPAGTNTSVQTKIEYKKVFNRFNLIPSVVRFRVESDSLPAAYGQPGIFTNRQGTGYGLKFDVPTEKFNVFAGFTEADVINSSTTSSIYQSDRQTYTLGAEAKYDIF